MLLGYNTNGFAHHEPGDALRMLAEIGYTSVALTLERAHLNPPDARGVGACVARLTPLLRETGLRITIETGARFLLDPRRKHQPTLISAESQGRRQRIALLEAAIDVASELSADSVALWSGSADDDAARPVLLDRLCDGLGVVLQHAASRGVRLSFEPEPGMLISTMADFAQLVGRIDHPLLGLTLDVGHLHCLDDGDVGAHVLRWRNRLWNVHIEDMRRGVHEHLMFGAGEMDFGAVFAALGEIDYAGPVHVELSRHSHDAVNVARRAHAFLTPYVA